MSTKRASWLYLGGGVLGPSDPCCWCRAACHSLAQAQFQGLVMPERGPYPKHPAAGARLVVIASSQDILKGKL